MPYPGQGACSHAGLLPGCWGMSQAGGQATTISRLCSSLMLEHSMGSKPWGPVSPVRVGRTAVIPRPQPLEWV